MKWIQRDIKREFNTKKSIWIKDMDKAVEKIIHHIRNGSRIGFYTDKDNDGLGCAVEWDFFLKSIGYTNYVIKVPSRKVSYGLNSEWIKENKDCDLMISSDCGITNVEQVELAKSLGIDFIVTDHHTPQEVLPNCIIVNPKLGADDFVKELCGAGIVWYIIRELLSVLNEDIDPMDCIDICTFSTISDMVEIDGANRAIIKVGLNKMNKGNFYSEGFKNLFKRFDKIDAQTISFGVAPITNSCGRLYEMEMAFNYITDRDSSLYDEMIKANEERKDIQHKGYLDALQNIDTSKNIIIHKGNYHRGLCGLISGEISNKFNKPSIIISENNKGSGRSIDTVHLYNLIFNSENEHICSGGGHKSALGVFVSDYGKFKRQLEDYCETHITEDQLEPRKYYWKEIKRQDFYETYEKIKWLEPFGMGNPKPNIVYKNFIIQDYRTVGRNKNVLMLKDIDGVRATIFKYVEENPIIKIGESIDILGTLEYNEYGYQILVEDMKISS